MKMTTDPIGPGQRYRDTQATIFGLPGSEWIVEEVFTGIDGVQYARVVSASDLTQRKTLSVAILRDRRRFERV